MGILVSQGLSETESRAYLTLLDHASMTAGALASLTHIPRSHLYKVLDDLHGKGLVEIFLPEGARAYRAKPLRAFLDERAASLEARQEALRAAMVAAAGVAPPPLTIPEGEPVSDVRILLGRPAVARHIDEMVASATSHLVLTGSDGGYERIVQHAKGSLPDVETEVILPRAAMASPRVRAFLERFDGVVRWFSIPRGVLVVVQDGATGLVVDPRPDTQSLRSGRDFGILSSHAACNADHVALLRAASESTPPASIPATPP